MASKPTKDQNAEDRESAGRASPTESSDQSAWGGMVKAFSRPMDPRWRAAQRIKDALGGGKRKLPTADKFDAWVQEDFQERSKDLGQGMSWMVQSIFKGSEILDRVKGPLHCRGDLSEEEAGAMRATSWSIELAQSQNPLKGSQLPLRALIDADALVFGSIRSATHLLARATSLVLARSTMAGMLQATWRLLESPMGDEKAMLDLLRIRAFFSMNCMEEVAETTMMKSVSQRSFARRPVGTDEFAAYAEEALELLFFDKTRELVSRQNAPDTLGCAFDARPEARQKAADWICLQWVENGAQAQFGMWCALIAQENSNNTESAFRGWRPAQLERLESDESRREFLSTGGFLKTLDMEHRDRVEEQVLGWVAQTWGMPAACAAWATPGEGRVGAMVEAENLRTALANASARDNAPSGLEQKDIAQGRIAEGKKTASRGGLRL